MKIKIFAASDRNNYGDLLFPLVIKKIVEKDFPNYKIENYGIINSDLSFFGALPTKSFKNLIKGIKEEKNYKLIIAGGEVLGGGWINILRFLNPFWNIVFHTRILNTTLNRLKFLERLFGFRYGSSRPFVFDKNQKMFNQIYYNSVGALSVNRILKNEHTIQYFRNVALLSVRDEKSKALFDKTGIKTKLIPDSALIMSDLFQDEFHTEVSDYCKELSKEPYLILQLGSTKGPDDLNGFVNEIEKLSKELNLKIILCPIGLALDHGDDIILKKIGDLNTELKYYHPGNVFEIMYLISRSKIYLGTSLHGLITAQSFNVPFFVFPQKITKIKTYIETWFDKPEDLHGDFFDSKKIKNRINSFDEQKEGEKVNAQKRMIYENLNAILK